MRFNPAEALALGSIAVVALIQFLRSRRDFSQVFYETVFLAAAVVAAVQIAGPLHQNQNVPSFLAFVAPLVVFAIGAVAIATLLNRVLEFDLGRAGWFFGALLALVCALLAAHAVLRAAVDLYGPRRPEFSEAVARSWLANQLYHYSILRNLIAQLAPAKPD
uniref:Uncharacterized protein n=1 Tax=candidate division WOR-3 bacterium TaxID=2052148 RepID=A0A7C4GFU6_UNCW3